MNAGYYYSILDSDEWFRSGSGLNNLLQEHKVILVKQTMFAGGTRVWLLIHVPKELGFSDSWTLGSGWEPTTASATLLTTEPEEAKDVPLSHSQFADTVETLKKDLDAGIQNSSIVSKSMLNVALAIGVVYVLVNIHPFVKGLKKDMERSHDF